MNSWKVAIAKRYAGILSQCRAGAPVLVRPVFLKVKTKFHFYKKQVTRESASVIFGLVRLIISTYNR